MRTDLFLGLRTSLNLGVFFAAMAIRWLTTHWLNLLRAEAIHIDVAVLVFAVGVAFLAEFLYAATSLTLTA